MSRETRNRRLRRMLDHGFQYRMGHGRAFLGYTGPDTRKIKCPTMIVHGKWRCFRSTTCSRIQGAHLRILDEVRHVDDNLDQASKASPKNKLFFSTHMPLTVFALESTGWGDGCGWDHEEALCLWETGRVTRSDPKGEVGHVPSHSYTTTIQLY